MAATNDVNCELFLQEIRTRSPLSNGTVKVQSIQIPTASDNATSRFTGNNVTHVCLILKPLTLVSYAKGLGKATGMRMGDQGMRLYQSKSQGQENEMHHPVLSLWHCAEIKDPLML